MLNTLRKRLSNIIFPEKNSMSLPNEFLKYGSKAMHPDWTQVVMNDKDIYTGYPYAAIRNRANAVARLAIDHVKTESKSKEAEHPYLDLINNSPNFSRYAFWYATSTYLDLEGVYYLMAIRNFDGNKYGHVLQFKLLNPYQIRRVLNKEELYRNGKVSVKGYVEAKNGFVREIPPEMIIEMRELNPFDDNEPFAMTDAAKEAQFTMKTSGDYTRHTLKHNINAPGVLSTDVILEPKEFENFAARVKQHTKGEPIFGNGKGAINWNSMNIDLSKAALNDVNEMNRDTVFSVAGVSKTIMGIEQSGTTRDTARVQKDLLTEYQTIPRIQLILDALNLDYKNQYPTEYNKSKVELIVDSPLKIDHDSDLKEAEVKEARKKIYTELVDQGYDSKKVGQYIKGEIEVDGLGEPDRSKAVERRPDPNQDNSLHKHDQDPERKKNKLADTTDSLIKQQEGALRNAITNLEDQLVAESLNKITNSKNAYDERSDVLGKRDQDRFINDLTLILTGFYGIIMSLQGGKTMRNRSNKFSLPGQFLLDLKIKKYIRTTSEKVAESHVTTVVDDILSAARDMALKGEDLESIKRNIRKTYSETITEGRAKTIARSETNRAFTRAQYEADRQFVEQNKLTKRAYKQWRTRSGNACDYCLSLERGKPIPFGEAFVEGDTLTVDGKSLDVSFETLQAGNAHPNCSCIYELIILDEK